MPANTLKHPVFGKLQWQAQYGWWFAQVRDASGEWLEIVVDPGDDDRMAVIEPAAALYKKAIRSERRILRDAVRLELLELYNDTWRRSGDPKLSTTAFIEQLEFTFIKLQPGWDIPVILSYGAGDLFGGHSVDVEVDAKLKVIDVDLVG
jgi:hypothetical protein